MVLESLQREQERQLLVPGDQGHLSRTKNVVRNLGHLQSMVGSPAASATLGGADVRCDRPPVWQDVSVTRRPVTVELDPNLVEAARLIAERAGVAEFELYERALRDVLVRDYKQLMDQIGQYQSARGLTVSDDDAMEIATSELKAMRAERRNAS